MTDLERQLAEIEASGLTGPNKLAATCEARIPALIAERDAATTKRARKDLNRRLSLARSLLRWATSRAGYVQPGKAPQSLV